MHDLIYHYDSPSKPGKYLGNRPRRMLLNNVVVIYNFSFYNAIASPFTKEMNKKLWAFIYTQWHIHENNNFKIDIPERPVHIDLDPKKLIPKS